MRKMIAVRVLTCASAVLIAASAFADLPERFANSVKYKDTGKKPATGRSGSASIMARALINKDGTADLDVTTGELDTGATPPGNINKVQLKMTAGSDTYTKNYNSLAGGGAFNLSIPGLTRGEAFQIQTNVSGIDPRRTDVVTVTETAKLRPDLAASDLQSPPKARINLPVNISAVVTERNRDVGAHATCSLLVDGTQADQAQGIWVDAAGSVSCAFSHSFSTAGTKHLKVAVTNVVPGDFDITNNTVEGDIEITNQNFNWYVAGAYDYDFTSRYTFDGTYEHRNDTQSGRTNGYWFYGAAGPIDFSKTLTATVADSTDGTQISNSSFSSQSGYRYTVGTVTYSCAWDWGNYHWFRVCGSSDSANPAAGNSWVEASRWAGDVTYHSDGWGYYYNWGSNYYTYNYDYHQVYGSPTRLGSTYEIAVNVTDGVRTYSADPTFPLRPVSWSYSYTYSGYYWWWYWYGSYGTYTATQQGSYKGVFGSTYFQQ